MDRLLKVRNKAGFTLVELMVIVLIVAVLAAVAAPIFRGRIDSAKWTEGRAGCATIASALRAYYTQMGGEGNRDEIDIEDDLGFTEADLKGKYFSLGDYRVEKLVWTPSQLEYKILCIAPPKGPNKPREFILYSSDEYEQSLAEGSTGED